MSGETRLERDKKSKRIEMYIFCGVTVTLAVFVRNDWPQCWRKSTSQVHALVRDAFYLPSSNLKITERIRGRLFFH